MSDAEDELSEAERDDEKQALLDTVDVALGSLNIIYWNASNLERTQESTAMDMDAFRAASFAMEEIFGLLCTIAQRDFAFDQFGEPTEETPPDDEPPAKPRRRRRMR